MYDNLNNERLLSTPGHDDELLLRRKENECEKKAKIIERNKGEWKRAIQECEVGVILPWPLSGGIKCYVNSCATVSLSFLDKELSLG